MRISPRFGPDKIASGRIEDFIDVYEDRMKGWMLDRADQILAHPDGGFAALAIAMGFFEQFWSFLTGEDSEDRSGEFFRKAFLHVFPNIQRGYNAEDARLEPDFAGRLALFVYNRARNGLFHSGMARSGILVAGYPEAIRASVENETGRIAAVVFNVRITLATIRQKFDDYQRKVRDPAESDARARFIAAWRLTHAGEILHFPPEPQ